MAKIFHFFESHNTLDTDGRPLSEDFELFPNSSEAAYVECPYKGKRQGRLMNNQALIQFGRNKDLAFIYLYFAAQLVSTCSKSSLADLWKVSLSAKWLVHYLQLLIEDYIPDSALAVVYKLSRGLYDLALHMVLAGKDPLLQYSIQEYIDFLNVNDLLVGKNLVCAAPETIIRSVIKEALSLNKSYDFEASIPFYKEIDSLSFKEYLDRMFRLELISGLMAIGKPSYIRAMPLDTKRTFEDIEQNALYYGQVTPYGKYLEVEDIKNLDSLFTLGIKESNLDLFGINYENLKYKLEAEVSGFEGFNIK